MPRSRLVERLNQGLAAGRPIALISAPAGFGKTVCVAEWVTGLDLPIGWLTLDSVDNDPERFFTYFIAVLQSVRPGLGEEIASLVRAGQLPPLDIIGASLVDDLLENEAPFVLVLDDFHVIQDASILQVFQTLVGNLPPALRLVLLAREDPDLPLARLRGRNQLTEIRAADLRLTAAETSEFVREVIGFALSPAHISLLADKTEGWIAGLQLACLSARDQSDPSGFVERLSGANRFIVSYLVEEVLKGQPAEVRDFLLRTSILEQLTGPLCDAVTGRTDGTAVLERLLNANVFLIPLDDEGRWYRYHQLFAELLAERLKADLHGQLAALHYSASRWYAAAGMTSEAIDHALSAGDYAGATELIERHAPDMLMQWHKTKALSWMRALPDEWAERCPETTLALAWLLLTVAPAEVRPYVDRLEAAFSSSQPPLGPQLRAQWLALRASLLSGQGRFSEAVELCQAALALSPEGDHRGRSMVYTALASAYEFSDEYDRACDAFQRLIGHGRAAGNLVAETLGRAGLGLMALQRGQIHVAFEVTAAGIELIERSGQLPPISQALYGELGEVCYQWHELDLAHRHFQRSIQVARLSGFSDARLYYEVILSRLRLVEGDLAGAAEKLEGALAMMKAEAPAAVREEIVAHQVRVYLAELRLADAELALARCGLVLGAVRTPTEPTLAERALAERLTYRNGLLLVCALRIHLFRGRELGEAAELKRGMWLAEGLADRARETGHFPIALKALMLHGEMAAAHGDHHTCRADFAQAVELAEAEGALSIFVEEGLAIAEALSALLESGLLTGGTLQYARRILAAFPSGVSPESVQLRTAPQRAGEPTVEALSERELDVLRLMAEGLTYREIGERLYVSLNTVRSHVKAVYGKLGVDNRTRAVGVARAQHLI